MKVKKRKHLNCGYKEVPAELQGILSILAGEFPLFEIKKGTNLEFIKKNIPGYLKVKKSGKAVIIEYGSVAAALRGITHTLAGNETEEQSSFTTLGIMLDCSRNAVMKVSHLKKWMRWLALLGYNMMMLYTEDTYQLPGEPYFGYMRGAYSMDEIKELDTYAKSLGIEMIACIQTLGHMAQILKRACYKNIMDTECVLLANEEKTYQLIDKMLKFWSEALSSKRIHLGMDEAQSLGRGRYMEKFGFEKQFDIFSRHLNEVWKMAEKYNLKPMIWSDMYFRMSNTEHDYYDRNSFIPDDIKTKVPAGVDLVYWDYYSKDEDFYSEWIRRHLELGRMPIMASGIWTWGRFWYDHAATIESVAPCIKACRKEDVKELFFTLWGDDISYCEFDSAFAGICCASDIAFGGDGRNVGSQFSALFGADYNTYLTASELQMRVGEKNIEVKTSTMMWDDPLLGIGWNEYEAVEPECWNLVLKKLTSIREKLSSALSSSSVADASYPWSICDFLVNKIEFRNSFLKAVQKKNHAELARLKKSEIPRLLSALKKLQKAFRSQWLKRNKAFGMEVMQIRLAAQETRFRETSLRIQELIDGKIDSIEELDVRIDNIGDFIGFFDWLATGSLRI